MQYTKKGRYDQHPLRNSQKRRFLMRSFGKTPTEIAEEESVAQPSVFESIERANAKIEKLKNK